MSTCKKHIKPFVFLFFCLVSFESNSSPLSSSALSESYSGKLKDGPEIFKIGVFLYNIFDVNFSEKDFTANFWVWILHSGKYKEPQKMFEVVNGKSVVISNENHERLSDGSVLSIAKVTTKVISNWNARNYPFDYHALEIMIEISGHDGSKIKYEVDCDDSSLLGFGVEQSLSGWRAYTYDIPSTFVTYPSNFGNPDNKYENFSRITPTIYIKRDWYFEFFKLFSVLYIAFFFALLSLVTPKEKTESKINLISIAVATIIVSKFVVEAHLPASGGFSLYSLIEMITLIIACIIVGLNILPYHFKALEFLHGKKYVSNIFWVLIVLYVSVNIVFIGNAYYDYSNSFVNIKSECYNDGVDSKNTLPKEAKILIKNYIEADSKKNPN